MLGDAAREVTLDEVVAERNALALRPSRETVRALVVKALEDYADFVTARAGAIPPAAGWQAFLVEQGFYNEGDTVGELPGNWATMLVSVPPASPDDWVAPPPILACRVLLRSYRREPFAAEDMCPQHRNCPLCSALREMRAATIRQRDQAAELRVGVRRADHELREAIAALGRLAPAALGRSVPLGDREAIARFLCAGSMAESETPHPPIDRIARWLGEEAADPWRAVYEAWAGEQAARAEMRDAGARDRLDEQIAALDALAAALGLTITVEEVDDGAIDYDW